MKPLRMSLMRTRSLAALPGFALLAALLFLGSWREAVASTPDNLTTLPVGTMIRVNAPRLDSSLGRNPWVPIVGTFAGVRRDTIEVQAEADRQARPSLIAIPASSIDRVERWAGKKGNGRLGMVIGSALGAGVAALVTPRESVQDGYAVAAGGLGGILWGGLIGSTIKTDRWEELPLTPAAPREANVSVPEGAKSPGRAILYSSAGTAVPVGIGLTTALGNNELSPGACVAIGGAIFGPSVGHFYAGQHKRAIMGIVARGTGGAMVWAASEADAGGVALLTGGMLLGCVFIVADIVTAPHSAHVHNGEVAEQVRLGATPWVGPVAGTPGVGVRLAF